MFLILIVPMYQIIKKSNFHFKYPFLFTIFTFGIYATQLVPPLYAMDSYGPARAIDIFYYSYYWLILCNIFYYMGWFKNKKSNFKIFDCLNNYVLPYTLIMICILLNLIYINKSYKNSLTFVANKAVKTGEAKLYYEEILERYKVYEDDSITDVIVKPLSAKPSLICGDDLIKDKNNINYWINEGVAKYFNKNSVNSEN